MKELVIYTTQWCSACIALKKLLDHEKIRYREIDVSDLPDSKSFLYEKTGYWGTPGITLNGEVINDLFDVSRMLRNGELDGLKEGEKL